MSGAVVCEKPGSRGDSLLIPQSGNWYYYLADGLGSTMAIVDISGNSQKSYQYDVYGEVTGGSGSLANEFDFAGQQTDGTGLQYLRARYYDPATGTFMSREPMAVDTGWLGNPSGYGVQNPAKWIDPAGTRPCDTETCGPGQRVNPHGGEVYVPQACLLPSHPTTPVPGVEPNPSDCSNENFGWRRINHVDPLLHLVAEYARDIAVGCQVASGLCTLAFGSQFVGRFIQAVGALIVTAGCLAQPELCPLAIIVGLVVGATGTALKDETLHALIAAGREERQRRRLAQ